MNYSLLLFAPVTSPVPQLFCQWHQHRASLPPEVLHSPITEPLQPSRTPRIFSRYCEACSGPYYMTDTLVERENVQCSYLLMIVWRARHSACAHNQWGEPHIVARNIMCIWYDGHVRNVRAIIYASIGINAR